jgi:hypothetical protein
MRDSWYPSPLGGMAGISASDNGCIYHLLSGSLGQGVTIPQIIDLDVLDVIAICDIDLSVQLGCALCIGRSRFISRAFGL